MCGSYKAAVHPHIGSPDHATVDAAAAAHVHITAETHKTSQENHQCLAEWGCLSASGLLQVHRLEHV